MANVCESQPWALPTAIEFVPAGDVFSFELVVDALVKANKDFDLLMLPNQSRGYDNASNYKTRRRWDCFVRHLLGAGTPVNYVLRPPTTPGQ